MAERPYGDALAPTLSRAFPCQALRAGLPPRPTNARVAGGALPKIGDGQPAILPPGVPRTRIGQHLWHVAVVVMAPRIAGHSP